MTKEKCRRPALKHGAFSSFDLLPGESREEFERLHREITKSLQPSGVLQQTIVDKYVRVYWRELNITTFLAAERANARYSKIMKDEIEALLELEDEEHRQKKDERAKNELGDAYYLIEAGDAATFDGLSKEMAILDRLASLRGKLLKELLMLKGIDSLAPSFGSPQPTLAPPKTDEKVVSLASSKRPRRQQR